MIITKRYIYFLKLLSVLLIFSEFVYAQENLNTNKPPPPKKNKKPVAVQWFQPELDVSESADSTRVNLSGRTRAKAKVKISGDEIALITEKGDVKSIKSSQVLSGPAAEADARGIFELILDLPFMTAQVPLEVTYLNGQSRVYQINLDVRKENVRLTNTKTKKSPYAIRKWGIWGGFGFNLLSYEQSTSLPSNLEFQSFAGPSLYTKIAHSLSKEITIQGTINRSPGKTQSSSAIVVTDGTYDWTFLTSEVTYFNPKWKFRYKKYLTQFGAQAGLQYHIVPFVARSSTTDPTIASVETNNIILAALGGTWLVHYDRYWLFETFLRYQYPISSGKLFDIEPNFAFDGSLGVIYKWKPDWRAGVFWYGQWHDYDISNHTDKFNQANSITSKITGNQALFFSNLEFRVGWEFD